MAGEVAAVGGVAADGEGGQLLAVEQPGLAGVAHADGGQERVGRLDVAGVGAELVDGGVRADVPVGLVRAAHPGRRDGGRRAQVQGQLAVRELHGGERRHRGALRADGGREAAQRLVGELHGGRGRGTGGVQGHLDRRELGRRGGDRAAGRPVPVAGAATGPQGHEQCPGQQDAPAGQTGEDPGRVEDRVVSFVDLVDVGGRRRRLLGLGRRPRARRSPGPRSRGRPAAPPRPAGRPAAAGPRARRASRACPRAAAGAAVGRPGRRLGAGDVELPADVDDVGVGQLGPAGLGDAGGGLVDLGPAVGVAELLLGDLAEGVGGLHRVVVRRCPAVERGQFEHPAGLEEARLRAEEVAVELGDLLVAGTVAEVVLGDRPQALPRLHSVVDGLALALLLRLDLDVLLGGCLVGGTGVDRSHRHRRRGGRGDRGCLGGDGRGDEQQGGQADEAAGCGLRAAQARQLGRLDLAEPGDGLHDQAQRHEGPRDPADHLEQAEDERAVVGRQERVLDAVQGRDLVRDRAGTDREEQCGQPEDDAEHGKRCSEACESLAQGGMGGRSHLSMPPSARMSRADASPVTCMVSRPMIPRNLLV